MLCFLVNPTLIKRLEAQKELHIYIAVVGFGFIWWSGWLPTKAVLGKIYF